MSTNDGALDSLARNFVRLVIAEDFERKGPLYQLMRAALVSSPLDRITTPTASPGLRVIRPENPMPAPELHIYSGQSPEDPEETKRRLEAQKALWQR